MRRPALAATALLALLAVGCEDRATTVPPSTLPPGAEPGAGPEPGPGDPSSSPAGSERPSPSRSPEEPGLTPTSPSPPRGPEGPTPEGQLALTSSLEAGPGGQWIARWSVRNPGQRPLYLVTQLPTVKGGRPTPDPNAVYLRADGQTLHLTKRMWRVPRGVSPLITELPYLVRLDPGQSHEGALRLPPAVASSFPYRVSPRGDETPVREVVISMGYFGESAKPRPSPEHSGLYLAPYKALDAQLFVTSAPHAAELRVR